MNQLSRKYAKKSKKIKKWKGKAQSHHERKKEVKTVKIEKNNVLVKKNAKKTKNNNKITFSFLKTKKKKFKAWKENTKMAD